MGRGCRGRRPPPPGRQPRRGKGVPGEENLCRAGQGALGRGSGQGVFTQCSWVFLAFATEPYYNKKRNWVTAPAGGKAREVF